MISVKNLVKCYGNSPPAVNDVSFEIEKGEIVGLLGPNGAGKTTIMKMLTCYMNPTEGEILIDGKNTLNEPMAIKNEIGYLPEHVPQYEEMTVYNYLKFVAEVRGIKKEDFQTKVREMVSLASLEDVVGKKIGQLSNGYRKRVGLASVMIHDPKILILDEPTAGLDPNQIIAFRKMLRKLSHKKTIILSTHILSEIEAICEKVIIIRKGRIAASDTLQNLVESYKDEEYLIFTIKTDSGELLEIEQTVNSVEGAWKIEFEKKDDKDIYRFKALITKGSSFEENLKALAKEKGWELASVERNRANLEEIFLKLTSEEEKGA